MNTALDPALGHEIKKTRPALVIQNDITNRYGMTTIVAAISSRTVDRRRLLRRLGKADDGVMRKVDEAISISLRL
jgi:mRNA interferase MazF